MSVKSGSRLECTDMIFLEPKTQLSPDLRRLIFTLL